MNTHPALRALLLLCAVLLHVSLPPAPFAAGRERAALSAVPLTVSRGWNLMAIPLRTAEVCTDSLFPTAVSEAYVFHETAGYMPCDSLHPGIGFWLKFDSAQTLMIEGEVIAADTIALARGWNIIGGHSLDLPVSILRTEPPGIITSPIYGFTPGVGYAQADTVRPGSGYWVKADAPGLLILPAPPGQPCPGIPTVFHGGQTYHTVLVGSQCWLSENLDIGTMVHGSLPQTNNGILEKYCYDNHAPNCDMYGGLYQWNEAMQYAGAQGICPPGWHLPTVTEFGILSAAVGGDGNALKAIGQGAGGGAGTNTSGFSALLAGFRDRYGDFWNLGDATDLWMANQDDGSNAWVLSLWSGGPEIQDYAFPMMSGFSVRCLLGEPPNLPPSPPFDPYPVDLQSNTPVSLTLRWSCRDSDGDSVSYDVWMGVSTPPDTLLVSGQPDTLLAVAGLAEGTTYHWRVSARDERGNVTPGPVWSFSTTTLQGLPCPGLATVDYGGRTYNTVLIGDQCWLRENLDIGIMIPATQDQGNNGVLEKYCYDNVPALCDTFGGLYMWEEAMQYIAFSGARGICPPGWRMPTLAQLQTLSSSVAGGGNALKAVGQGIGGGAGTNGSGFSALLAGDRGCGGGFYNIHDATLLWSSSVGGSSQAAGLGLNSWGDYIDLPVDVNTCNGYSVRCIYGGGGNEAPGAPDRPIPDSGGTGVYIAPTLRWSCSDPDGDSLLFDVYFGTDNPPATLVAGQQPDTSLARAGLLAGTTYHWRVVAFDGRGGITPGPVWTFTTQTGGGVPCPGTPTVTYGGKTYNTVQIGAQCWLKENLTLGTMIPGAQEQSDNGLLEKYCYGDDPANCVTHAALYQWREAMQYVTTAGSRGICPPGWHIPTLSQLQTLSTAVGGVSNALKAIGEGSGGGAGTNTSGFTGLLAGFRYVTGAFMSEGNTALIWSSTQNPGSIARTMGFGAGDATIGFTTWDKIMGLTIRCLKD